MKISKSKKSQDLLFVYDVVAEAQQYAEALDVELHKIAKKVKISGFREGKAPFDVVKAKYKETAKQDSINNLMNKALEIIFTDEKYLKGVELFSRPVGELVSFEEDKKITFELFIEKAPEIDLSKLKDITVTKKTIEIEDKDIAASLEDIASKNNVYKDCDAKEIIDGHAVTIDFVGSIDGKDFDGGAAKDHVLVIGSNSFIPGFESALIGKKLGEEVEIKLPFPKDYHAKEFAGKDAVFKVNINKIQEVEKAKIDDELAKKNNFQTLEEMKEKIKESYKQQFENVQKQELKKDIFDKLIDMFSFVVPQNSLNVEIKMIEKEVEENKLNLHGMSVEERAKNDLILRHVFQVIIKDAKINVTDKEVDEYIVEQSKMYAGQEQMIEDYFRKSPQVFQSIKPMLMEEKFVQYITKQVTIEDKKTTMDNM